MMAAAIGAAGPVAQISYQAAGAFAVVLSAVVALMGWQLSRRAQVMTERRQHAVDQGPYVESLQGWSREIVAWWQSRVNEVEEDCARQLAEANDRADYWKRRAQGLTSDDTPHPQSRSIG